MSLWERSGGEEWDYLLLLSPECLTLLLRTSACALLVCELHCCPCFSCAETTLSVSSCRATTTAGELTTLSQTSWLVRTAPLHAGLCRQEVENFNFTTAILVDFIIIMARNIAKFGVFSYYNQ